MENRNHNEGPEGALELQPDQKLALRMRGDVLDVKTGNDRHIFRIFVDGDYNLCFRNDTTNQVIRCNSRQDLVLGQSPDWQQFLGENMQFVSNQHLGLVATPLPCGDWNVVLAGNQTTNGTFVLHSRNGLPDIMQDGPSVVDEPALVALDMDASVETPNGRYFALTECAGGIDKYTDNQDGVYINPDAGLIAVADGMGGEGDGSLAALEILRSVHADTQQAEGLAMMFPNAVMALRRNPTLAKNDHAGATLAIAQRMDHEGIQYVDIATCGDAKAIVVSRSRKAKIYESKDQTRVQTMADHGILTGGTKQLMEHPDNNVVQNAVKVDGLPLDPTHQLIEVAPGDIVVLASDGIWDVMTPEEVALEFYTQPNHKLAATRVASIAKSRQWQNGGFNTLVDGKWTKINSVTGDNIGIAVMDF
jgi:PPM family protein phosphatase